MDWLHPLAGLLVGLLVGVTGVGGGSLMAPILVLLVGVAPTTAVGTDLWFAAITKTVGGLVHHRFGDPDWRIVRLLAIGSLPASVAASFVLSWVDVGPVKQSIVMQALGVLLVLSAIANIFWSRVKVWAIRLDSEHVARSEARKPWLTILCGALLGVMVTFTSVGAGALGAIMLMALYPLQMTPKRLVGTDIVHAVPLTVVAGLGHLVLGNVNVLLLGSLLIGSIPGIIVGSLLASRMRSSALRILLALVLAVSGIRMLVG